jgi:hypothetical protein
MAKRGRKTTDSIAAESILIGADVPRITSPEKLTDDQAEIFADIVSAHPGRFFEQSQAPLVCQLVRHIVTARRLSVWIDKMEDRGADDFDAAEYFKALESRRKETASINSLCRSLRLTNQSRYRPESAAKKAANSGPRPWEGYGP